MAPPRSWRHAPCNGATVFLVFVLFVGLELGTAYEIDEALARYAPKACKFNVIPHSLNSLAYTSHTGEVRVGDVFGLPSTVKRHIIQVSTSTSALLTLQAEVHRETPAKLMVDVYLRGAWGSDRPGSRLLSGRQLLGAGGEDAKVFLHGHISESTLELDIVFELSTIEVARSQVDSRVAEDSCWPVRLDISVIPQARAALNWPLVCPRENKVPPTIMGKSGSTVATLDDAIISLAPRKTDLSTQPFVIHLGRDDRAGTGFGQSIWDSVIEVPPRLHRFARFFFRVSFRFPSGPLQLVLELFDLKDELDQTALQPTCAMGCLGGVPVYNGQLIDHAMPTGFIYRVWLLQTATMDEWVQAIPVRGRRCLEFDMDYSISFQQGMTPFEIGPAAWMCQATRLPSKIIQAKETSAWNGHFEGEIVVARSVWLRDRFSFPPNEVADMEHKIELEVTEPSIFRATTHHSDGVDVFVALSKRGSSRRVCKAIKHPGPVPRQSIFCYLEPGSYDLTFFADYPLGGIHPCGDFFAQIAIRPMALSDTDSVKQCIAAQSDLSKLAVTTATADNVGPNWKAIKVPIKFGEAPAIATIWRSSVEVLDDMVPTKPYLKVVVHSSYITSDLRFQVRFGGKYVADTAVTAHGYADMIGPLSAGTYEVEIYYVTGTGPVGTRLCSSSTVDIRLVPRQAYGDTSSHWICAAARVPPPDQLMPQPDEQVLLDSEYSVPPTGLHTFSLKFTERRLVRVVALSASGRFEIVLAARGQSDPIVTGVDNIQAAVDQGDYVVTLSFVGSGREGTACPTFTLNLLLQPEAALMKCPWTVGSMLDVTQGDEAAIHLDKLSLDLSPKTVSKDHEVLRPKAVSMWMSLGMQKSFEMSLTETSAVRVEISIQPPFLPIEVVMRRKRSNGKLESPTGVAAWTEGRLLLMRGDVPKGTYMIEFLQTEDYHVIGGGSLEALKKLCSHVTITAEVGVSSKEEINSMRAELLEMPDLLAVQPIPPSMNTIGWHSSAHATVVGTQVYRFPDGVGRSTLRIEGKSLIRIVSEPADLSNSQIDVRLSENGNLVASSDEFGQLVTVADAGTYELELRPHEHDSPFLVTFAVGSQMRLQQDVQLQDSGAACAQTFPTVVPQMGWAAKGWMIGPLIMRLPASTLEKAGELGMIPVTLAAPSVLYIEVGSSLPLDLVRIGISVPEGIWLGEQRGFRNSLALELPEGEYSVQLSQPKPAPPGISVPRCLDFSVLISASPLRPDSASDAAADDAAAAAVANPGNAAAATNLVAADEELTSREEEAVEPSPCFSAGTVPLPLDLTNKRGGSETLGGPIDEKTGRLLLRGRVLIPNMHDGRKKTYMKLPVGKSFHVKVGVSLGGYSDFSSASELSHWVMDATTRKSVPEVEQWSTDDGWERIYTLVGGGYWLVFHHPHRERSSTACLHFGLQIEIHPVEDMERMTECDGNEVEPSQQLPSEMERSYELSKAQSKDEIFKISKPHLHLRQAPEGFFTQTKFTLRTTSWVAAEVGFNFFTSHGEMDLIRASATDDRARPLASSKFDFIHGEAHPLDGRLMLGEMLPPGDYVLRVADDHYKGQFSHAACFPFSFDFIVVPRNAPPTVISVMPHPSVPLSRGADLVVTLRFSEPPRGSIEEVVKAVSLGGVMAHLGGSVNHLSDNFARKHTSVQASVEEGHRLWIVTFHADILETASDLTLKLDPILRSNVTGKMFKFDAPTYTVAKGFSKGPWFNEKAGGAKPASSGWVPFLSASSSSGSTGSTADAGVGGVHMEGGGSVSSFSGSSGVGQVKSQGGYSEAPQDFSHHVDGMMPNVEIWHGSISESARESPSEATTSDPSGCPEGTHMTGEGICEAGYASEWPLGYRSIVACSGAGLVFVLYTYGPRMGFGRSEDKAARFRDVGFRTSEEELGLVSAVQFDDDML